MEAKVGRKHSLENTDVIVECAYELIRTEGFSSFSTRRLAAKLDVSKTTAYNYLPNKEEIIEKVVARAKVIFHQGLEELAADRNYAIVDLFDCLLAAAEALYIFVKENGDIFKLMFRGFNPHFEGGLSALERIAYLRPVFARLLPDYDGPEHAGLLTEEKLDKYYFISVMVFELCLIELNRVTKIEHKAFMAQVCDIWSLLSGKMVPESFCR